MSNHFEYLDQISFVITNIGQEKFTAIKADGCRMLDSAGFRQNNTWLRTVWVELNYIRRHLKLPELISMSRAHRIFSWCMSDFTSRFSPRISPRLSWTAVVFWVIHISWVWLLTERWKGLCLNIAWHALSFSPYPYHPWRLHKPGKGFAIGSINTSSSLNFSIP